MLTPRTPGGPSSRKLLRFALFATCLCTLMSYADQGKEQALSIFRPDAAANTVSGDPCDPGPWQTFLDRYLIIDESSGIHLLRYAHVSTGDKASLDAWLVRMAATDPRGASRDAQMAYWINLYNALTVQLILEHPGISSIRSISSGLFRFGPWDRKLARIAGTDITLNDIEHRILRPLFQDPRSHFAVNCASLGCPNLATEAYTEARLEHLLESGTRAYINHPRGVRFEKRHLILSSIFDWYRSDFPARRIAFLTWLAHYAAPELAERLRNHDGSIKHAYDWALNAAP